MSTTLRITSTFSITPPLDIHNPSFAESYRSGLWWSLYGNSKDSHPVSDSYLVENIKQYVKQDYFDEQQDDWLPYLGFYFGMMHGSILSPQTGETKLGISTITIFHQPEAAQGYKVGRRDYSYDIVHIENTNYTDRNLLDELRQISLDLKYLPDEQDPWYYSIGCILGNLSIALFPPTPQEWQEWEVDHREFLIGYKQ